MPRILYPQLFTPLVVTPTWDPTFLNTGTALSNNNLTATITAGNNSTVRSTTGKFYGKWYFEVTLSTISADVTVGIVGARATKSVPQLSNGSAYILPGTGGPQSINANYNPSNGTVASTSGDVVSVAVNLDQGLIWFSTGAMRTQSTNTWNNLNTGDPVGMVGGMTLTRIRQQITAPWYAAMGDDTGSAGNSVGVLNIGASPWSYAIPSGYSPWAADAAPASANPDRWAQPASTPVRRTVFQVPAGTFAPIAPVSAAAETVTLDKWFQPASQPVARPPIPPVSGSVGPVSTAPETILLDKWFQPPSQPVARPPIPPVSGLVGPISTSPEAVTVDRWVQPTNQRPAARPVPPPSGIVAPIAPVAVAETVTLDKWFQPASQPTPPPRRLIEAIDASDGPIVSPAPAGPEVVTADRWVQPPSQPVARRAVAPPSGVVAPLFVGPENVTLDKWFQPASQPLIVPPSFVRQLPSFVWSGYTPPVIALPPGPLTAPDLAIRRRSYAATLQFSGPLGPVLPLARATRSIVHWID